MRAGEVEGVELGMLFLQRAAPCERAVDRDLAELLEVGAAGVDARRLQAEIVLQVLFMPGILVGRKRMHGADLARAERLVGLLLRRRAARHGNADLVRERLEEVVQRKPAREID